MSEEGLQKLAESRAALIKECRECGDRGIVGEVARVTTGLYEVLRKVMTIARCKKCGFWVETLEGYSIR